jgi:hypothetical protein
MADPRDSITARLDEEEHVMEATLKVIKEKKARL